MTHGIRHRLNLAALRSRRARVVRIGRRAIQVRARTLEGMNLPVKSATVIRVRPGARHIGRDAGVRDTTTTVCRYVLLYGNVLTKTVTDTSVTPNVSRTWTYTYYNSGLDGQVHTLKGPRTDLNSTTTYTYYTCTSGSQCGQIQTVTDAVGNVTTLNTYNAYGQPLTITDPNGVVTTLTYDARERITSRQVGTETTAFSYYPTGLLNTVTLPDSSTLTYTYDDAHRLTQIADGAGNSMRYTLDALGNRTAESAYDPSSTLDRTLSRVYNSLSELYQLVGAAGTHERDHHVRL